MRGESGMSSGSQVLQYDQSIVCTHMCMCACVWPCVSACKYEHKCTYTHQYTCILTTCIGHIGLCMCVHANAYVSVCTHVYTRVCVCVCMRLYISWVGEHEIRLENVGKRESQALFFSEFRAQETKQGWELLLRQPLLPVWTYCHQTNLPKERMH